MNSKNVLPVVAIALVALLVFSPIVSALFENDVVIQPGGGSGTPGAPGSPGVNASCNGNLTVNSTTTLLPGTSAYVISAWNGTWASMDFGIPRGAQGIQGEPGTGGGDTSQFVFLNGTRAMSGNFSVASNYIVNMILPSVGTDGANKLYVDNVNATNALNTSYAIAAANTTMNLNTSLAIVAANTSMKNYADAADDSHNTTMNLNVSLNYASKVGGYVPTAQLGSGVADNTKYLRGDQTWAAPAGSTTSGYDLSFLALTSSPGDNAVVYIGGMPKVPGSAGQQKVWVPHAGNIKAAFLTSYSGTAGTAETWGMDLTINGTVVYAFANKTLGANERTWSNTSMGTPVSVGNYLEFKSTQPNWGTDPLTTLYSGVVYIEES